MAASTTQLVNILSASIAPVIVISGVGLLLLSMTNRYGRVIDRARVLGQRLATERVTPHSGVIRQELRIVYQRARLLRTAIILSSVSILFVAITIFSLFAAQVWYLPAEYISVPSFGASMVALIASLYFFIRDVTVSLQALELEISSFVEPPGPAAG